MKKSIKIKKELYVSVNKTEKKLIGQLLNEFFTGKKFVPLNVETSKEHQKTSYKAYACHIINFEIEVFEDGSWKLGNLMFLDGKSYKVKPN